MSGPPSSASTRPNRPRTTSLSSDRPSIHASTTLVIPSSVSPEPAFVAASAASQLLQSSHDQQLGAWYDEHSLEPSETLPSYTLPALRLVNSFLDRLLFQVLFVAKGTCLAKLRPALTEVLKPKLAKDAILQAETELEEYLGEEDAEEDSDVDPSSWDVEFVWKRTRLRCMVYSSLGNVEEEDEDYYLEQDHLDTEQDLIAPASAIFLTSVLEYLAEQLLNLASTSALNRLRAKVTKQKEEASWAKPVDAVVVEEHDMERIAMDRTLGRLWRTWKKRVRDHQATLNGLTSASQPQSPLLTQSPATVPPPTHARSPSLSQFLSQSQSQSQSPVQPQFQSQPHAQSPPPSESQPQTHSHSFPHQKHTQPSSQKVGLTYSPFPSPHSYSPAETSLPRGGIRTSTGVSSTTTAQSDSIRHSPVNLQEDHKKSQSSHQQSAVETCTPVSVTESIPDSVTESVTESAVASPDTPTFTSTASTISDTPISVSTAGSTTGPVDVSIGYTSGSTPGQQSDDVNGSVKGINWSMDNRVLTTTGTLHGATNSTTNDIVNEFMKGTVVDSVSAKVKDARSRKATMPSLTNSPTLDRKRADSFPPANIDFDKIRQQMEALQAVLTRDRSTSRSNSRQKDRPEVDETEMEAKADVATEHTLSEPETKGATASKHMEEKILPTCESSHVMTEMGAPSMEKQTEIKPSLPERPPTTEQTRMVPFQESTQSSSSYPSHSPPRSQPAETSSFHARSSSSPSQSPSMFPSQSFAAKPEALSNARSLPSQSSTQTASPSIVPTLPPPPQTTQTSPPRTTTATSASDSETETESDSDAEMDRSDPSLPATLGPKPRYSRLQPLTLNSSQVRVIEIGPQSPTFKASLVRTMSNATRKSNSSSTSTHSTSAHAAVPRRSTDTISSGVHHHPSPVLDSFTPSLDPMKVGIAISTPMHPTRSKTQTMEPTTSSQNTFSSPYLQSNELITASHPNLPANLPPSIVQPASQTSPTSPPSQLSVSQLVKNLPSVPAAAQNRPHGRSTSSPPLQHATFAPSPLSQKSREDSAKQQQQQSDEKRVDSQKSSRQGGSSSPDYPTSQSPKRGGSKSPDSKSSSDSRSPDSKSHEKTHDSLSRFPSPPSRSQRFKTTLTLQARIPDEDVLVEEQLFSPPTPRQIHTSGSSGSTGTNRLRPIRTSDDDSRSIAETAPPFEDLIQSGHTIQYTLTPEPMRDFPSPLSSPASLQKQSFADDLSRLTGGNGIGGGGGGGGGGAFGGSKSRSASISDGTSRQRALYGGGSGAVIFASSSSITSLPSTKRQVLQAREARTAHDSTTDIADFIRSTGPHARGPLHKGNNNSTNVSGSPLGSSPDHSSPGSWKTSPPSAPMHRKALSATSRSSPPEPRLQARDPVTDPTSSNTAELVDLLRKGPPRLGAEFDASYTLPPHQHGSLSPRGASMDEFRHSHASTTVTEASNSFMSSVHSQSALLRNQPQAHGLRGAESPNGSRPGAFADGLKTYKPRIRDPYAIDYSDDEDGVDDDGDDDDDDSLFSGGYASMGGRLAVQPKEESLAEFLQNCLPPEELPAASRSSPSAAQLGKRDQGKRGVSKKDSSVKKKASTSFISKLTRSATSSSAHEKRAESRGSSSRFGRTIAKTSTVASPSATTRHIPLEAIMSSSHQNNGGSVAHNQAVSAHGPASPSGQLHRGDGEPEPNQFLVASAPPRSSVSDGVERRRFEPRDPVVHGRTLTGAPTATASVTADLVDFLRNSEPPAPPVYAGPTTPTVKAPGSLAKMFRRKKSMV